MQGRARPLFSAAVIHDSRFTIAPQRCFVRRQARASRFTIRGVDRRARDPKKHNSFDELCFWGAVEGRTGAFQQLIARTECILGSSTRVHVV
eukprot:4851861-Pleurochrysis_carterae.AAC.1